MTLNPPSLSALAILGAVVLGCSAAVADPVPQDFDAGRYAAICENTTNQVTARERVSACTAILKSGYRLSPRQEAMTRLNRGWSYSLDHDMADARADYDKALVLDPESFVVRNERGLFALRLGRFDDAIAEYDEALKIKPDTAYSLFGRGVAHLRKGETTAGQDDLAAARRLNSNVDAIFAKIGVRP